MTARDRDEVVRRLSDRVRAIIGDCRYGTQVMLGFESVQELLEDAFDAGHAAGQREEREARQCLLDLAVDLLEEILITARTSVYRYVTEEYLAAYIEPRIRGLRRQGAGRVSLPSKPLGIRHVGYCRHEYLYPEGLYTVTGPDLFGCDECEDDRVGARIRAACTAMSRFLTFVWMEAETQWGAPFASQARMDAEREQWLAEAVKTGRLTLAWPEPKENR